MVIAAEFGAFAPLALVQTRPPWALEPGVRLREDGVHRLATHFVQHGTIGANTFPSGHVAGSLAVAFAVMGALPVAGAVFLVLALSIALACVVGRYHYVVDVIAGAVMALAILGGRDGGRPVISSNVPCPSDPEMFLRAAPSFVAYSPCLVLSSSPARTTA